MIPKFRAWDTINKKMISWRSLLYGHDLRNVFMRPEMCGLKLMQSTRYKDINGVEILTGDIVIGRQHMTTALGTPTEIRGQVKYSIRNTMYYLEDKTSRHDKFMFSIGSSIYQFEIIGNIYENPELLEVEG